MKWITHQTGAVAAALALNMPPAAICAAFAGAVFPDVLDQGVSHLGVTKRTRQRIFNQVHRGSSHWFGWWLALFIVSFIPQWNPLVKAICAGAAFGGLSHVFLDMLTTRGVPLFPFTRKGGVSLGLCSTGKIGEYVFLAAIIGASVYFMGPDIPRRLRDISRAWF